MPAVGTTAPDFELLNQDGKPVKLSNFRGQKVLLFAYPKAGTSGCTVQACGFRDSFAKIETSNAIVLGLSPDEPAALAKWITEESLQYDLLSDPEHRVLEAWDAWGERSNVWQKVPGRHTLALDHRRGWYAVLDAQVKVSPKKSIESALKFLATAE